MKKIPLTQGKFALVDDDIYEYLTRVKWSYNKTIGAFRSINAEEIKPNVPLKRFTPKKHRRVMQLMGRVVMSPTLVMPSNIMISFNDDNNLNLQKYNLRLSDASQKQAFTKKQSRTLTSKYKGVFWDRFRNKWRSEIKIMKGPKKYLGRFDKESDAAHAYNLAAIKYFGEFARINKVC